MWKKSCGEEPSLSVFAEHHQNLSLEKAETEIQQTLHAGSQEQS